MKSIEEALDIWRGAERRVQNADGGVTPEMRQEVVQAKQRYQDLATAHTTEWIDALHAAEARRAPTVPSSHRFHDATAEEKRNAQEISSQADQIDREACGAAAG
jgi:hypothetical protein